MGIEQAEWAIQSLYEDMGVRDELSDGEAAVLLAWGEAQVMRLAETLSSAEFEVAFDSLRGLLRRMNRLAARRGFATTEDLAPAVQRVADYAHQLGFALDVTTLNNFLNQPVSQSAAGGAYDSLNALIGLLDNSSEVHNAAALADDITGHDETSVQTQLPPSPSDTPLTQTHSSEDDYRESHEPYEDYLYGYDYYQDYVDEEPNDE